MRSNRLLNTQILHRKAILYKTKVTSKPYKTNVTVKQWKVAH